MNQSILDKFGEILVQRIRDKAINDWEMIIDGRMKGLSSDKVRDMLSALPTNHVDILRNLIPRIVDTTLHHLLWTVEQADFLKIMLCTDDGVSHELRELSDGLPGELYGDHGWIKRFSSKSLSGI